MNTGSFKRIVVATDFSAGGDAAFARALSLAASMSATVNLVHVVDPQLLVAPTAFGAFPITDGTQLYEEVDRALVARVAQATDVGVVCQTDSLDGNPASEIVRHAKATGSDLIVVGTHGRTGIAHAVLGSIAERVVQRAACPVLVVPNHRGEN